MKIDLLVQFQELSYEKQRLAHQISQQERTGLARVMLEGVLRECSRLPGEIRKVMATSDVPAMALARRMGFDVLEETHQESESESVDRACALLEGEGVTGVLRVPLDLPLLDSAELAHILELAGGGMRAVLVPSRDGMGTNALYRSPPTLFPSRFGPGSLALHQFLAREQTEAVSVVALPTLGLDIDDAGDVAALLAQPEPCPAKSYLEGLGAAGRLGL